MFGSGLCSSNGTILCAWSAAPFKKQLNVKTQLQLSHCDVKAECFWLTYTFCRECGAIWHHRKARLFLLTYLWNCSHIHAKDVCARVFNSHPQLAGWTKTIGFIFKKCSFLFLVSKYHRLTICQKTNINRMLLHCWNSSCMINKTQSNKTRNRWWKVAAKTAKRTQITSSDKTHNQIEPQRKNMFFSKYSFIKIVMFHFDIFCF